MEAIGDCAEGKGLPTEPIGLIGEGTVKPDGEGCGCPEGDGCGMFAGLGLRMEGGGL